MVVQYLMDLYDFPEFFPLSYANVDWCSVQHSVNTKYGLNSNMTRAKLCSNNDNALHY